MRKHSGAHTILLLIAVAAASVQAYVPVDQDDKWLISLNGQWRFALNGPTDTFHRFGFDDSDWASIQVPSNWEVDLPKPRSAQQTRYKHLRFAYGAASAGIISPVMKAISHSIERTRKLAQRTCCLETLVVKGALR